MGKYVLIFLLFVFAKQARTHAQTYLEFSRFDGTTQLDNSLQMRVVNGETYVLGTRGDGNYWLNGNSHTVVTKYSASGTQIYSVELGGTGFTNAREMVVSNGEVYVISNTRAADFTAHVNSYGGYSDLVLSKISTNGDVLFSTYLGGSYVEEATNNCIQVVGNDVFVAGYTESWNFPLTEITITLL